ncbi:MAG: hypothetical protein GTO63_30190 [Anaerolineae bacterium]|nr:hypothetical protein [Anaerolineae bacterium]NIN98975.1 hypothetical protein [Anaerolineae bacterium]
MRIQANYASWWPRTNLKGFTIELSPEELDALCAAAEIALGGSEFDEVYESLLTEARKFEGPAMTEPEEVYVIWTSGKEQIRTWHPRKLVSALALGRRIEELGLDVLGFSEAIPPDARPWRHYDHKIEQIFPG